AGAEVGGTVAQFDHHALGGLHANARDAGQRGHVAGLEQAREFVHAGARQHRQRDLRADAGHLLHVAEQPALAFAQETVQRDAVLLLRMVGEQRDLAPHLGQVVERAHRRFELVAHAVDVDHEPRWLLVRQDSPQPADHPPRLRNSSVLTPVRPAVALMCAWVSATASASAASACSFASGMFNSKRTMCCTCALSAAPRPTSDCLISRGAYSLTGSLRRTTVASAAPRAWPSFSAEVADLSMNTVSIATCCGCHSSSRASRPSHSRPRRDGKSSAPSRTSACACT